MSELSKQIDSHKLFEGWLFKKGTGLNKNWKMRYFIIYDDRTMSYYKCKSDICQRSKAKGTVHLTQVKKVELCVFDENTFIRPSFSIPKLDIKGSLSYSIWKRPSISTNGSQIINDNDSNKVKISKLTIKHAASTPTTPRPVKKKNLSYDDINVESESENDEILEEHKKMINKLRQDFENELKSDSDTKSNNNINLNVNVSDNINNSSSSCYTDSDDNIFEDGLNETPLPTSPKLYDRARSKSLHIVGSNPVFKDDLFNIKPTDDTTLKYDFNTDIIVSPKLYKHDSDSSMDSDILQKVFEESTSNISCDKKFSFALIDHKRTWILAAANKDQCREWVSLLSRCSQGNPVFSRYMIKQGKKVKNYKKRFCVLHENKVLNYYKDCETMELQGDIDLRHIYWLRKCSKDDEKELKSANYDFNINKFSSNSPPRASKRTLWSGFGTDMTLSRGSIYDNNWNKQKDYHQYFFEIATPNRTWIFGTNERRTWYSKIEGLFNDKLSIKLTYYTPCSVRVIHSGTNLKNRYLAKFADYPWLIIFPSKKILIEIEDMTFFNENRFKGYIKKKGCTNIPLTDGIVKKTTHYNIDSAFVVRKDDRTWYVTVKNKKVLDKWLNLLDQESQNKNRKFSGTQLEYMDHRLELGNATKSLNINNGNNNNNSGNGLFKPFIGKKTKGSVSVTSYCSTGINIMDSYPDMNESFDEKSDGDVDDDDVISLDSNSEPKLSSDSNDFYHNANNSNVQPKLLDLAKPLMTYTSGSQSVPSGGNFKDTLPIFLDKKRKSNEISFGQDREAIKLLKSIKSPKLRQKILKKNNVKYYLGEIERMKLLVREEISNEIQSENDANGYMSNNNNDNNGYHSYNDEVTTNYIARSRSISIGSNNKTRKCKKMQNSREQNEMYKVKSLNIENQRTKFRKKQKKKQNNAYKYSYTSTKSDLNDSLNEYMKQNKPHLEIVKDKNGNDISNILDNSIFSNGNSSSISETDEIKSDNQSLSSSQNDSVNPNTWANFNAIKPRREYKIKAYGLKRGVSQNTGQQNYEDQLKQKQIQRIKRYRQTNLDLQNKQLILGVNGDLQHLKMKGQKIPFTNAGTK